MKTIKLFMIAAALFISGNLFAQTVADYQNRLHDLQLCKNYYSTLLSASQMNAVDAEINGIMSKLNAFNSSPLAATPLDNFIQQNPNDPEVMAYIKILATYTEPSMLLGHDIADAQRASYVSALTAKAAVLATKY
jgi:hypothetical protein